MKKRVLTAAFVALTGFGSALTGAAAVQYNIDDMAKVGTQCAVTNQCPVEGYARMQAVEHSLRVNTALGAGLLLVLGAAACSFAAASSRSGRVRTVSNGTNITQVTHVTAPALFG